MFPLSREKVQLFVALYITEGNSVNNLSTIVSHLRYGNRITYNTPLSEHENKAISETISGAKKMQPTAVKHKTPLTILMIKACIRVMPSEYAHKELWVAIALTGHNGLLRFGEILKLILADFVFFKTHIQVRLRSTKTKKEGGPVFINLTGDHKLSANRYLRQYWAKYDLHNQDHKRSWLNGYQRTEFVRVLQELSVKAGFLGTACSGHSLRAGGTTDLWLQNIPAYTIQLLGRWTSDAFKCYITINLLNLAHISAAAFESALNHRVPQWLK
jgi:integrase